MTRPGRSGREEAEFQRFHYPGTEVLINRLGVRDPLHLDVAERGYVDQRLQAGFPSEVDPRTYAGFKALHRYLFQDVYEWAGQERTYTTGRGAAPFATPENIQPWMEKQFEALKAEHYLRGLRPEQFARKAAVLVNEINAAHPFIEGNGRTQRTWLRLVGLQAGHRLVLRSEDRERWYEASRIGFERVDHDPMARLLSERLQGRRRQHER